MKNISSLEKAADKERQRAEGQQREAQHQRDVGHDDAARTIQQDSERHENLAQDYDTQVQDLRNKVHDLERQRETHEQNIKREQDAIDSIDQEIKLLNGETHTLF